MTTILVGPGIACCVLAVRIELDERRPWAIMSTKQVVYSAPSRLGSRSLEVFRSFVGVCYLPAVGYVRRQLCDVSVRLLDGWGAT